MKRLKTYMILALGISAMASACAQKGDLVLSNDTGEAQGMDFLSYPEITVKLENKILPDSPEGDKALLTEATSKYSGWGLYVVSKDGEMTDQTRIAEKDLSAYSNGHLMFWLKSSIQLRGEIEYVSRAGVTERIPFIIPSTKDGWVEIKLPFSKFPSELNFERIRSPFMMSTESAEDNATWQLDNIRWTRN